MAQERVI